MTPETRAATSGDAHCTETEFDWERRPSVKTTPSVIKADIGHEVHAGDTGRYLLIVTRSPESRALHDRSDHQ